MKFAAKDADVRGEVQSVSSGGTKFDLVAHIIRYWSLVVVDAESSGKTTYKVQGENRSDSLIGITRKGNLLICLVY